MANIQNLQPGNVNHTLTPEEQHRGGLASAVARKRKSICSKILNSQITSEQAREQLKQFGLDDDEMTEMAVTLYDLYAKHRNTKNIRDKVLLLDTFMKYAGQLDSNETNQSESPTLKIEIVDNEKNIKGE